MRPHGPIESQPGNFQGLLLAAHPGLKDPNFRRSVLFLSDARAGSGHVRVDPQPSARQERLGPAARARAAGACSNACPVYVGGPVGQDQLRLRRSRWDAEERPRAVEFQPFARRSGGAAGGKSGGRAGVRRLRGLVGRAARRRTRAKSLGAGASREQTSSQPDRIEKLWFQIMSSLGPDYKLLAAAPDDPSLN